MWQFLLHLFTDPAPTIFVSVQFAFIFLTLYHLRIDRISSEQQVLKNARPTSNNEL